MAVDVGSAVGYLDLDISGFLKSLRTAQNEAEIASNNMATQIGSKFSGVGKSLTTAGKTLTTAVTAPVAGLGAAAIKTTADFESAMSKVSSISGATGDELVSLTDKAKEMGAKTKFSASESAEAFTYMAMAGWKTEDMLAGIDGIMSLAAADGLDLATTSDIVTDALTAFGMSAEESGHFADVLAKASSSANTNVSMLGESFKYVAPVAGSLGYSAEDTAIALGLMANSGIKASQGGTALRSSLTKLIKPTSDGAALMSQYGIEMTNADGSMKSLGEVMAMLRDKLGDLTESEQAQVAATLFGQEAMSGMLAIINASDSDFENLTNSIYNAEGAAQQMADVQLDNLSGQLTILKSALEGAAIQIGEIMLPYVKDFVAWIQNLVQKFSELSPTQQEWIIKLALAAAVIGPVLLIIGKLTSGIGNLITNVGKITSLFGSFGSAASAATGPATSAATGIGGLAQSAMGLLAAGAGILLASAGLALLAISAIKLTEAGWPAIAVMGGLVVALAGLAIGAAAIAPALTAGAVGLVAFGAAITLIGVGILAASSGAALLATQLPTISKYGGQAAAALTQLGGALVVFSTGILTVGVGLTALGAGLTASAVGVAALLIPLGALTIELGLSAAACGLLAAAMGSIALSVSSIESSATSAANSLEDMIMSVDIVKSGLNGLKTVVSSAMGAFVKAISGKAPSAGRAMTSVMNKSNAAVSSGISKMQSTFSSGMSRINSTIKSGFSTSTSYIRSLSRQARGWGADIIQGIASGIRSKMGTLKSAVIDAANVIRSNLHFSVPDEGPLTDYESWMPDFMEGLAKGINDNSHLVKSAIQNVTDDMKIEPEYSASNLFTTDDVSNLKSYNVTLINTLDIYKQLVEQMKLYSEFFAIALPTDNGLLKHDKVQVKTTTEADEAKNDKDNNDKKPDQLIIPISIGDEQIENVVVDLLRREVRI